MTNRYQRRKKAKDLAREWEAKRIVERFEALFGGNNPNAEKIDIFDSPVGREAQQVLGLTTAPAGGGKHLAVAQASMVHRICSREACAIAYRGGNGVDYVLPFFDVIDQESPSPRHDAGPTSLPRVFEKFE